MHLEAPQPRHDINGAKVDRLILLVLRRILAVRNDRLDLLDLCCDRASARRRVGEERVADRLALRDGRERWRAVDNLASKLRLDELESCVYPGQFLAPPDDRALTRRRLTVAYEWSRKSSIV